MLFFYKHIQINTKVGTHFRCLPENAKLSIVCPTTRIYLNEVNNSRHNAFYRQKEKFKDSNGVKQKW